MQKLLEIRESNTGTEYLQVTIEYSSGYFKRTETTVTNIKIRPFRPLGGSICYPEHIIKQIFVFMDNNVSKDKNVK